MPKTEPIEKTHNFVMLTGSKREADSLFLSPYYSKSFEFPYNPDPLCRGNNYDIYDEMMSDDQVKATIAMKKNFVINTGWEIVCEDEKIKEFLLNSLNDINKESSMETTFDDILEDMLSSYEYGFSISEPIFDLNDEKLYIYKSIKTRPPHSFKFNIDEYGNVINIEQQTGRGNKYFKTDQFLHHVYQPKFGNPYGLSDLNAAHADWKAKKFIKRFLAIYLEKFASPTVVGRYDEAWGDDEIARFNTVLKSIQNNTTLIAPKSTEIDFIQNQKDSSDTYMRALDYFNLCIARAILVPDLLGMSGGKTAGGSFSLGVKQFEIFLGTIKKDRKSLEKKLTSKLIQSLVDINFGKQYRAEFRFIPFTEESVLEYAKLWVSAVNGKMWVPSDDEINYLRKLVGFPEGDVERPQLPEPLNPNGDPKKAGADDGKGEGDPKKKEKEGDDKDKMDDSKKKEFAIIPNREKLFSFRPLTAYEKKVDFVAMNDLLESYDGKLTKKLMAAGKDIYSDYLSQVRDKGLLRRFEPEKINVLEPKFLRQMNSLFLSHFQDIFKESYIEAQKEIITTGVKKFDAALLPEEFLDVIKAESFKLTGDYSENMTKKAKSILLDGMKQGIAESEIIKLIRDEMEQMSERWVNTMVRTKTTEIYNNARRSYYENDEIAKQLVTAYLFSAILDERTSEICESLDGNIYSITDDVSRVTPPLHYNSVAKGEKILTLNGYKNIEDISVGDYVFTHKKRFKKVLNTMRKPCDNGIIRIIKNDIGIAIRVTDEHPLLVDGKGWVRADTVEVGDKLYQNCYKTVQETLPIRSNIGNPENYPPLFVSDFIPYEVTSEPIPMSISIAFNNYFREWYCKITNSIIKNELMDKLYSIFFENIFNRYFRTPFLFSLNYCHAIKYFGFCKSIVNRIIPLHSFGMAFMNFRCFFSHSISPMILSYANPSGNSFDSADSSNIKTGKSFDPMFQAPSTNGTVSKMELSFNGSKGFFKTMVMFFNKLFRPFNIFKIKHFYTSTINDVLIVAYHDFVYNIEVEEDNSYLVNGVIVHNCRSMLVPVTKFEDYKAVKVPTIEKMKEEGAGLKKF